MNKKLLLGALVGAGISMLNKKMRQRPQAPDIARPDFSRVPPPTTGAPQDSSLDDIFAANDSGARGEEQAEDNPREKVYMDRLAEKLGISEQAAHVIEEQLPHAA